MKRSAECARPQSEIHPLQIWLLSPYHTGSHAAWAAGLARHSRHQLTLLTMTGTFWKWRMEGGAVALAAQARPLLAQGQPDLVLATDMVNLPAWLALLRRELPAGVPVALYMHENQLTYPWRPGAGRELHFALMNWLSQLSADAVIFNSRYHRRAWFRALPNLLKHFPDYNHLEQIELVAARSRVLPVGIEVAEIGPGGARGGRSAYRRGASVPPVGGEPPLILWNQRWEYDKRPDLFFELLYALQAAGIEFRLAVAGENVRQAPAEFVARGSGWPGPSSTGAMCQSAAPTWICSGAPIWSSARRNTSSLASPFWRRLPRARSRCCPAGSPTRN